MSLSASTFYVIGGTLRHDAPSYMERQADKDLLDGLLKGQFCYVLTSRQMGKSSLMVRTASKLREQDVSVVVLDLTAIGLNLTPEQWYDGLLVRMGRQLDLEDELENFWEKHPNVGPCQRFFAALRDVVLARLIPHPPSGHPLPSEGRGQGEGWARSSGHLVVFIDEIDVVRSLPFNIDEFFAAIRECYNRRTEDPEFNRLTFSLLGVASPSDLISNPRLTPFNIGRRIELGDFTPAEAGPLAKGLATPPTLPSSVAAPVLHSSAADGGLRRVDNPQLSTSLLERILYWTSGHPYLTQRLCQAVARQISARIATDENAAAPSVATVASTPGSASPGTPSAVDNLCQELFLSRAARERDDNLLFVRERILRSGADLLGLFDLYGQVLSGRHVRDDPDSPLADVLRISGLVKRVSGRLNVRNRIYARVFDFDWLKERVEVQRASAPPESVERALAALRQYMSAFFMGHPTGQLKQVTVLCAEVLGLSTPPAQREPAEWVQTRKSVLERLARAVAPAGGVIDNPEGESIRALFGTGVTRENEPERAVRAALGMQAELRDLAETVSGRQGELSIRIGLNTGPIIIKPSGATETKLGSGPTVQLARQLCQMAPANGILISHDTWQHVRERFEMQPSAPVSFGTTSQPIPTYLIQRAKPRGLSFARQGLEGIETRMIGREAELRRLQDALAAVQEDRELQIATVVGEAGIGKSRLLYEFNRWLEPQRSGSKIFSGRAREGASGLPYFLLRDLFASAFEIQDSDRPALARQKLERGLVTLMAAGAALSPVEAEEFSRSAHFMGHLAGLDFSASPHLRGTLNDAKQIRDQALQYLTRFFQAISGAPRVEGSCVLLLLEDIHWADDGSLELIDHLVRTCRAVPLLILCATRPSLFERRPAWGEGESAHTRLNLQPLSKRDSRQLVEEILQKIVDIPQALRELIVSDGEGNPFYIEELVKMLIEVKVILPGADHWQVDPTRLSAVRVPATLAGVLQARLDGLPPRERGLLQRASVIGRVFWDSALEQFISGPESLRMPTIQPETAETLKSLRRKELIFRREASAFAGATEYLFRHALLRDVTYESVLPADRRQFHGQAAAWLIEQSGERASEFAAVIAAHYEAADDKSNAAEWYGRAGAQARATYAPQTAIEYYQKALAYLTAGQALGDRSLLQRRLDWLSGLGESLAAQARFSEATDAYESMRAATELLGDLVAETHAWNGLAFVQERRGANRVSVDCASRAAELATQAGSEMPAQTARARALFLKGWAFYRLGDAAAVLAHGEEALALCTELAADYEKTNCLKLIAVGHLLLGHHDQADEFFKQALALSRALGYRRNVGAMLSNLGETARSRGDYEAAVRHYQEAIAEAREIGNVDSELLYLSNLGGALVGLGHEKLAAAEAHLKQVIAHERQQVFLFSETYRFLAEALLGQGKVAEALDAARRALALGEGTENQDHIAAAWRALGKVSAHPDSKEALQQLPASKRARVENAGACFAESLKIYSAMGADADRARTLQAWAACELQRGDRARGTEMWQEARQIFGRLGMPLEIQRMNAEESESADQVRD